MLLPGSKKLPRTFLLATLCLTMLVQAGCGSPAPKEKTPPSSPGSSAKIAIAHRGASGYLPEHTLEAYAMAYGMGADYIEPDVVMTKDGVPIVMHDIHLDANTNVARVFPERKRADGRYYAIDFTLAEIKQLSVNERIDVKTGKRVYEQRFPLHYARFEVPTLEEVIQLVQGLNQSTGRNVGLYPEMKEPKFHTENGKDIGTAVLQLLDKYGYNKPDAKIYVQCFDPDYLRKFREQMGAKMPLVQLIGEEADCPGANYDQMMTPEGLDKVAQYANGIGPWHQQIIDAKGNKKEYPVVNPNLVADAHKRNLVVHPYTFRKDSLPGYVKNLEEMLDRFLYQENVDGVFCDFPDVAVKAAHK